MNTAARWAALARRLGVLTLIAALGPTASAQQTPGELGRLFFTPERRQNLDRQRQLNIQEKPAIPDEPTLTINGVVTRSGGQRTVWINGVAQTGTPNGVTVTTSRKDPGQVVVQPAGAPAGKARVGDTINRNTGETTDLLDGGRITTRSGNTK